MTCTQARHLAEDVPSCQLTDEQATRMVAHIEGCPYCEERYAASERAFHSHKVVQAIGFPESLGHG